MTQEQIQNYILEKYPGLELEPLAHDLTFIVPVEQFEKFCTFLKTDLNLLFQNVMCMTAVDNLDSVDVVYFLNSYEKKHKIGVKVRVTGENLEVPSMTSLWPGANWHERECYDLYGVKFTGHPDLRRILLPDDWEGYPMRKNYKHWNLTPLPDSVESVTKDYPLTPSITPYGE